MKGRKIKKIAGLVLIAALVMGLYYPIGNTQAEENAKAEGDLLAGIELLAHYEFQDGGRDSSGNNNDAVIGSGVTVSNGVASLPGGDKDSSAYITLPQGMFDNQDTMTIAMWLKDNDPRTSWLAAFFFGSAKNSHGMPSNYYYFVPCEKDHNTLKLVMTDSVKEEKPSDTEKGFRESTNTESYCGKWTHYAIVIQPDSFKCYINGQSIGTQTVSRSVSDFGTGLQSYIGKSNYDDPLYQGDFKDFRVYKNALNEEQIMQVAGIKEELPQYSMKIDANNVTKKLNENLYGLFFEDINSSADGGLYPEMVKNYSFENAYVQKGNDNNYFNKNGYETVGKYKLHWVASPEGNFAVNGEAGVSDSLNETNPHYAILTGNVTLQNGGFAPQSDPNSAAMPVKPVDTVKKTGTFTFSTFAKAPQGYNGILKVKLVDSNNRAITDEKVIDVDADGSWKKVSAELTSNVSQNTKGKLVLSVEDAGANDKLFLDMVSVVPHDSYGYGNPNYACGVGVRKDLVDLMMDLDPTFMRFPGGCIVEGFNWEGLYDWRDSVGPLEVRKSNTNRWENFGNNNNRTWGYIQSFGFGYHELLSLCEDFDMEPFPILSAGVLCQYETKDVEAKTGEELQEFIDMATDLLDYCWGDATKNEWAKKREQNGHPQPFNLKYLGIGNENAFAKYYDNFEEIKSAVELYAQTNYPGHELHIISSAGPTSNSNPQNDGYFSRGLEYAYDRLAQNMPGETLVDEHYYESESFMYNQSDRYDYYQRTNQGGSDVFVGEYAVRGNNKYYTALAEACYITGLERNADVVKNISYAPLLYKVNNGSWDHDLIYFDEFNTAKSTNYYVQKMFSNNYGTDLIGTELKAADKDYSNYGSPILGMIAAEGYIDKVIIYDKDGKILLEDDFYDNSNGWETFGNKGSNSFSITGGRLVFTGTSGQNAVYLPRAVQEKWKNFRVEVQAAEKTSGDGGFVVGAGYDKQYYWYNLNGDGANMEVTRPQRGSTSPVTKMLGNNFANKHYNQQEHTSIQTNDAMDIFFNFGVGGKLEANYVSTLVPDADTAKYDFSSVLNQYQTDIYQVVNKDDKNVYVKLVNPDAQKKQITLNLKNLYAGGKAEITTLTGGPDDANAIGNEVVAPQTVTQAIQNNTLTCKLSSRSVNVIRIPIGQEPPVTNPPKEEPPKEDPPAIQPSGVSLNVGKSIAIGQGESVTLKATVKPNGASQNVSWTTDKKSIVSVKNGKIKGLKPGKSVITAKTTNGKTVKCTVTVKKKPGKISLNAKKKTLKKGKTFKVKVKFPKNTCSYKLSYSSSKSKVAAVSSKGVIKAKKKGKAVITVKTFNKKKAKITITVK